MGNRAVAQQGEKTGKTANSIENYFRVKNTAPVLMAFVVGPDHLTGYHLHRLLVVTSCGVSQYNVCTGRLQRSCRAQIDLACYGSFQKKKTGLAYVTPENVIWVMDAASFVPIGQIKSEEKVTALRIMWDGFISFGTSTGELFIVSVLEGVSRKIDTDSIPNSVVALFSVKSSAKSYLMAGFHATSASTGLVMFAFASLSFPPKPAIAYTGLTGTCVDIAIFPLEKLLFALGHPTAETFVWDLINCALLLKLQMWPDGGLAHIRVMGGCGESGGVKLAVGGKKGVVTGVFNISENSASWTQRNVSKINNGSKILPGAATSLEYEEATGLLVYGDELGQVWLLSSPASHSKSHFATMYSQPTSRNIEF